MKNNADDLARRLAETIQAKEAAEAELAEIRSQLNDASIESKTLRSQSADLGLQVRVLTREIAIRDDPSLAYEAFDPVGQDHPEISDIDAVITNNLTMFKKLPQLLEQNKKLLRISRELGRKLEEKASSGSPGGEASDNDLDNAAQAIENLTETVNSLRAQVVDSRTQLELSIKERDMYSRLLVQGRMLGLSSEAVDKIASGQLATESAQGQDDVVRNVMSGIQAEFEKHRDELKRQVKEVQEKVEEKTREVEAERERTASALASLRHEQSKLSFLARSRSPDAKHLLLRSKPGSYTEDGTGKVGSYYSPQHHRDQRSRDTQSSHGTGSSNSTSRSHAGLLELMLYCLYRLRTKRTTCEPRRTICKPLLTVLTLRRRCCR
jgi:nucleoprotein TPR